MKTSLLGLGDLQDFMISFSFSFVGLFPPAQPLNIKVLHSQTIDTLASASALSEVDARCCLRSVFYSLAY